ncbi:MAG: hypothetical protein K2N44_11705 [Lachnospiraceae bacterium]|nr:hypothetical protein [Lachnospiraceae bacterium]
MGAEMSAEAIETRRAYQREYRRKNREKINSQRRNWRARNRDKVQQYNKEYWERRAEKAKNIRASWEDYGITPERLNELMEIVRSDECAKIVMECALKADRKSAGHIILSITKGLSYEHVEFHERLGRCPLGRTDFYGARRLFFHYLDCALRNKTQEKR